MARKKKVKSASEVISDNQKIEQWLQNNEVNKIAKNVSGNPEIRSFFGMNRKRPKQIPQIVDNNPKE